jgi:DNA-binding NarL/FixJ family response regulator
MLMDLRMPRLDGIAATRAIREDAASALPRIVVLTTFERDEAVAAALRAGADGFLLKDATPDLILSAIRTVHDGTSVIAHKSTSELFRTIARRQPEAIEPLSVREKEVFLLAARGLSNTEIGRTAFIAEATVKTHIRSILAKLGLTSRVQLVAFAYENGLVR